MSSTYREMRNLCEIMRSLNYTRTISIENFKTPNFKLLAEILYWFIKRYDSKANVPEVIDDENDRVEFIIFTAKFFWNNMKIKLNTKKLYASDNGCVSELLKIAETFFNAKSYLSNSNENETTTELDLSSKTKEIKELNEISSTIVETGLGLLDLLDKEKVVRSQRDKAIEFLENITKGGDSKKEKEQIEKRIISILQTKEDTLEQLESHIEQLKQKENQLEEDLKIKKIECERAEKRLESIIDVRPKEDNEQRELEIEMQQLFKIYVDKIRNNDYLENKLIEFNEIEKIRERLQEAENEEIGNRVFAENQADLHDENENIVYGGDGRKEWREGKERKEDDGFNIQNEQNKKREQLMTRGDNVRQKLEKEVKHDDDDEEDEEDVFNNEEEYEEEDERF